MIINTNLFVDASQYCMEALQVNIDSFDACVRGMVQDLSAFRYKISRDKTGHKCHVTNVYNLTLNVLVKGELYLKWIHYWKQKSNALSRYIETMPESVYYHRML
eukprot:852490_1